MVRRGEVWLADLDPTIGAEIKKTRPCVLISPPEMHDHLRTVLIAPMTTGNREAPFRVPASHAGKKGLILLDQIRAIDKSRLIKRLGVLAPETLAATLDALRAIFHD